MSKKIILPTIIVLILIVGVYQGFFKKEKPVFTLAEARIGNIFQEVSETGQVKKGEEINLSFKNSGRIEKIYAEVGDQVESGENLAKLETIQLQIQLQEAKAAFSLVQSKLNKLLTGASPEEIQVAETTVANAETSLESTELNLKDVNALSEENLNSAYEDALNVLDDCCLKANNTFNLVYLIQRNYFINNDQESIKVRENKDKIKTAVVKIKSYLDTDKDNQDIDSVILETKGALDEIGDALRLIREVCEVASYRNIVSSTDKTSLDTQKSYINTALTNIINSKQTISSTRIANQSSINTAQSSVCAAQGAVIAAQNNLTLLVAPPRQEDIDLYQAQVNQAQAQVQLLENQVREATLKSPIQGQIIKINKKIGELVHPGLQDIAIVLLPTTFFVIETNIYEEDIIKINIGNQVDISLVAFPEQEFLGKVISIEPAEKLIEGVVYYKVTISFNEIVEKIKPGMTADVIIKTAFKENVLIIPENAIQKKDGKQIVEIFKDGISENKEIETGLFGSDDMVQVISGIKEGEKLILR